MRLSMPCLLATFVTLASTAAAQNPPKTRSQEPPHKEERDDPPGIAARTTAPPAGVRLGPYTSVQVNLDSSGNNIVGDAANEPSIGVDPTNPAQMVIGWRQFDTVFSNFRQAGMAYSHDSGANWTFPGVLDPGQFRSDPVLDTDDNGIFYYYSLSTLSTCEVFISSNGGVSWSAPAPAWGGDKNWMAVDRSGGIGNDNVYCIWQRFFNCCDEDTFTRSIDGASTFQTPIEIPDSPTFGIIDVATDGTVSAAGIQANDIVGQNFNQFVVSRSTNAKDSGQTPAFVTRFVDLGGSMGFGDGPNPSGLLGQAYVRSDPNDPNIVYSLCSVNPPGSDPLDVNLIKSTDGGVTWSDPQRINRDTVGNGAWQWFGTLAVADDGRLDVIWNDTRNGTTRLSELFYAWSHDGGETWFGDAPVSPQFDSYLGWPDQNKLGDYYDMKSDERGADVAYAATFNGEQDVYYVRLFPDCNDNGISDFTDIEQGTSADIDGDGAPDECEALTLTANPLDPDLGDDLDFRFLNGFPGTPGLLLLAAVNGNPINSVLAVIVYGADGNASLNSSVPNNPLLSGLNLTLTSIGKSLQGINEFSNNADVAIQ